MTSPLAAGVHFKTDEESLKEEIGRAMTVYAHGLERLYSDRGASGAALTMSPALSCMDSGISRWSEGEIFYRSAEFTVLNSRDFVDEISRVNVGFPLYSIGSF